MLVSSYQSQGCLCLLIEDMRIDASVAVQFKEIIRGHIGDHKGRVLMDLRHVDFLDSSGLGAIVAVYKGMHEGQKLELSHLTPLVAKVIALTRMDQVFVIHETTSAALEDSAA